jgi:hypothetical protein
MDPLEHDIWSHLGHMTQGAGQPQATQPATASTTAVRPPTAAVSDQRQQADDSRRRFDRGGRRRTDWPDDAGLSGCPGCGFEHIQSLGVLDSGDYLWQCPQCDRRFQTGRASRTML